MPVMLWATGDQALLAYQVRQGQEIFCSAERQLLAITRRHLSTDRPGLQQQPFDNS